MNVDAPHNDLGATSGSEVCAPEKVGSWELEVRGDWHLRCHSDTHPMANSDHD